MSATDGGPPFFRYAHDNKSLRDAGPDNPWGSSPGVESQPLEGCSALSCHGEWFFQTWCDGLVGLFALDTKHQRLWGGHRAHRKGGTSWPPIEVPLIGEDQWASLEEALRSDGLRALYVASDTPFLDNSIADAQYKITQPEYRDLCHTCRVLRRLARPLPFRDAAPPPPQGPRTAATCTGSSRASRTGRPGTTSARSSSSPGAPRARSRPSS